MFKKLINHSEFEVYFNNLFNSLEEGILLLKVMYDDNGQPLDFTVLEINEKFEKTFRINKLTAVEKTVREAYPKLEEKWLELLKQAATTGESSQSDVHFDIADKHFRVKIITPVEGYLIVSFNDITDKLRADEFLEKHFILFENAHDIILYLKSDGSIIDANKTAIDKYGYSYFELINMNIQQLRHESMKTYYKGQMDLSASKGIVFEGVHVCKDGNTFPVEVSSRSIDVKGELLRIHIIRDITERKEAEEKIKYLANFDALTGIANRGYLMRELNETMDSSAKENLKFAVLLFDVDKFKSINDIYGHNAGDDVLRTVANRLQQAVDKPHLVGRLGGDEFLVIQKKVEDLEQVTLLAKRIFDNICKPIEIGDKKVDIHISLGTSVYPEASQDIEGLIQKADTAMYAVKKNGGNSYK